MFLDRWITYIFGYHESGKGGNVGFAKIVRKVFNGGDYAEIEIGIKNYSLETKTEYKIYLVRKAGQTLKRDLLDEGKSCCRKNDLAGFRYRVRWDDPCKSGSKMMDYAGIVIVDDGDEIYAGFWKDIEFDCKKWACLCNEKSTCTKENVKTVPTAAHFSEKQKDLGDIEFFFENNDKLPVFMESQIVKGVKIKPKDIGRLNMSNWHLGNNSFLNHGYFRYRYLLLGMVKIGDGEKCVIGVPSVYSYKEKYLANMFGFRQFVPAKKCKYMAGNFGYWILEVTSE